MHDWEKAKPIMEKFIARTKNEPGCLYYGWVRDGNQLKCREGYQNGAAVNANLENVGSCIQAILAEGVASLDSLNIHGPAAELEAVKPGTEALGTKYFATDGGFSKYVPGVGKPVVDAARIPAISPDEFVPYTVCSIHPTFTVHDWEKAKPIMEDFISRTKTEEGCTYYGWTRVGNTLKCR